MRYRTWRLITDSSVGQKNLVTTVMLFDGLEKYQVLTELSFNSLKTTSNLRKFEIIEWFSKDRNFATPSYRYYLHDYLFVDKATSIPKMNDIVRINVSAHIPVFRPHCMHASMRPMATDVAYTGELCENGWTDCEPVWGGADSRGSKEPCNWWGPETRSPPDGADARGDKTVMSLFPNYFGHLLNLQNSASFNEMMVPRKTEYLDFQIRCSTEVCKQGLNTSHDFNHQICSDNNHQNFITATPK